MTANAGAYCHVKVGPHCVQCIDLLRYQPQCNARPQNWNVHIKGLSCLYSKVLMVLREIISAHALTDPSEQSPPPEDSNNSRNVVF
jgi:hypothetical protein